MLVHLSISIKQSAQSKELLTFPMLWKWMNLKNSTIWQLQNIFLLNSDSLNWNGPNYLWFGYVFYMFHMYRTPLYLNCVMMTAGHSHSHVHEPPPKFSVKHIYKIHTPNDPTVVLNWVDLWLSKNTIWLSVYSSIQFSPCCSCVTSVRHLLFD